MNNYMIAALVIAWFASGFFSFAYWWTKKLDVTSAEIPVALCTSLFGPFNFLLCWLALGRTADSSKVLFKKRK